MLEVHECQTAKFLKNKILDILKKYHLNVEQVFSITTDNGSNMLAAAKQLQQEYASQIIEHEDEEDDQFIRNLTAELGEQFNIIRCAIHTLQLALNDVIGNADPKMQAVTNMVKQTRKVKYKNFFEYHNASYPPLWSATRWCGKYKMIESVMKQEQFFIALGEQYPETAIDDDTWRFIKEYETAFKPFYKATKMMQSQHQPFSEFYIQWLNAVLELHKLESNRFIAPLSQSLMSRFEKLKQNNVFRAALYLDPRFNYLNSTVFTPEEKEEIQEYLIRLWERMTTLREATGRLPSLDISSNESSRSIVVDDMDDFLTNLFGGTLTPASSSKSLDNIRQQIKMLEIEPRQPHTYSVWNHWLARKSSHPEVYDVAMLVHSSPSSQASVERAFSALSLVLTSRRTSITDDILENTLLLKLNADIVEHVAHGSLEGFQ
ncbi:uncharacterized protein LOC129766202 [Toxorhynchites rutilus septentrionalis]|uniref:uncharacterized protein LOC129766202 n=1 Tax=Toxorhynchites rutilus septentrionalis TaxID=329112 RepID=UPI002479B66D|nr:uncharacterized protein LOC129766202 [Toxorhynchites rutilus septentrionalis]